MLTEPLPAIASSVVIEGGGLTISGNREFRVFEVRSGRLEINDLRITGGKADRGGAFLLHSDTTLLLKNSKVEFNSADYGGAISSRQALIVSENSEFHVNSATVRGGAIDVLDSRLKLIHVELYRNHSQKGAAISAVGGNVLLQHSSLIENGALAHGGALYARNTEVTIESTRFSENKAFRGAALYSFDASATIRDSAFTDNRAGATGGAIFTHSVKSIILDTSFADNEASKQGGAIYVQRGILELTDCSFDGNSAETHAGALYSEDSAKVIVNNSTFAKNSAEYGGGVYVRKSDVTLTHVTFAKNIAVRGGGLYKDSGMLKLRNSIVDGYLHGDCFGGLDENINNLIEDGSCRPLLSGDPFIINISDAAPHYVPVRRSPAINAGHPEFCLATDQSGSARAQDKTCDLGAYEALIRP